MRASRRHAVVAAVLSALAGCAQFEGDFGRPKRTLWREDVAPALGAGAARLRGEPVSMFAPTDDEKELRDLAYGFFRPPDGYRAINGVTAELRAARLVPNLPAVPHPGAYAEVLLSGHYRSTTARWQRLIDDVRSDDQRLAPIARVAARVGEMDRVRRESAVHLESVSPEQREEALARIAENQKIVLDVCAALAERIATYTFAMEQLVVAQPAPIAVEAERAVTALDRRAGALCGPPPASPPAAAGPRGSAAAARIVTKD